MKNFKPQKLRKTMIGKKHCTHPHAVVYTTGGYFFHAGEVDDDIAEHIYCPDCGRDDWVQHKPYKRLELRTREPGW